MTYKSSFAALSHRLRSWCLAAGPVLAAVGLTIAAPSARGEPLMQLSGSFTVTPTGAAAYTIPIDVPPGTAGMSPSISLNYTSQGGNGIVGVGWTLGGLPSITRCPTTMATEGIAGAVTYTSTDRFCLEGQKLIGISGNYGAGTSSYYTEVQGFSRIVSNGQTGPLYNPTYFTVQTKSGQTMTFGDPNGPTGSSGSSPLAAGTSVVRVWALSKVTDTSGNYLTIKYSTTPPALSGTAVSPGTNEAPYPTEIDYTANCLLALWYSLPVSRKRDALVRVATRTRARGD
jgi:hypothetical protein